MNLLEEWFGDSPSPDRRICTFALPGPRVHWHLTAEAASKTALSDTGEAYFGVGLVRPVVRGRGKAEDIVGIGGLWADLDWRSTKAGKPLAGDPETLLEFVRTLPVAPSCIVNSGGGLHLYWIFREPWVFDSDAERDRAAAIAHDWHAWIISRAPAWQLENCGDLSRVLRVPGTMNRKYGEAVPCEILESNDSRYSPDDFEDFVAPHETNGHAATAPVTGYPKAFESKFAALLQGNEQFRATWDRDRHDLADSSPSGYDLSLATLAAVERWTDPEIHLLIDKHRNFYGDKPEKARRPDYLRRTIDKARTAAAEMLAMGAASDDVDLSGIFNQSEEKTAVSPDPGQTPADLLRIPGFVSELMDFTLATAPYPNSALAFAGAIAMQSLLSARKVRDSMDNRTNLYVLALASSGSGKDWPRKVNVRLAHAAGILDRMGDRFASAEGLEDALSRHPAMLFQTDEIDSLLAAATAGREGRYDSIVAAMLNFYSQSNSVFKTRKKSGKDGEGATIVDPSLTLFGTATPRRYYESVGDKLMVNGFFARMLTFDAGHRGFGHEVNGSADLPARLVATAKAWEKMKPGGNLSGEFPQPDTVPATEDADRILRDCRELADEEFARCESAADEGGMASWARTWERARKLALLYACSARPLDALEIDEPAARWASALSVHQTRRALYLASVYRRNNEFEGKVTKLLDLLRRWHRDNGPDAWMQFRLIGRKLRWDPRDHDGVRRSLLETGELEVREFKSGGRNGKEYRLVSKKR